MRQHISCHIFGMWNVHIFLRLVRKKQKNNVGRPHKCFMGRKESCVLHQYKRQPTQNASIIWFSKDLGQFAEIVIGQLFFDKHGVCLLYSQTSHPLSMAMRTYKKTQRVFKQSLSQRQFSLWYKQRVYCLWTQAKDGQDICDSTQVKVTVPARLLLSQGKTTLSPSVSHTHIVAHM